MNDHGPIMVAVGGDSGTGKTTLVTGLHRIFGTERITNICLDDYHRLDRAARKRAGVTALDPAANDLDLMTEQVGRLRRGESIVKPTYDHSTGTFGPSERVTPREIVVIRGLFPLFTAAMRAAFDLRIWLEPQEELKWSWKVRRDCVQRGYSVPEVIRQLMDRRDDQLAYIAPQAAHADLVVRFRAPDGYFLPGTTVEHDDAHLDVRIDLQGTRSRSDLDEILALGSADARSSVRWRGGPGDGQDGPSPATLEIDGSVSPATARSFDAAIRARLGAHAPRRDDDIGGYLDGVTRRHSDPLALTQLLVAFETVRGARTRDGRARARFDRPSLGAAVGAGLD
jgi:phosphoribulokinase